MYGFLIGVSFFSVFLLQGCFSTIFAKEIENARPKWLQALKPLSIGAFYLLYAITAPTNHTDTGFLFYYPIYY